MWHAPMHKTTMFALAATILLTATVSVALFTVKAVNAQGNMSSTGGAKMTKSNMTNATSGAVKNATAAVQAPAAKREGSGQQ